MRIQHKIVPETPTSRALVLSPPQLEQERKNNTYKRECLDDGPDESAGLLNATFGQGLFMSGIGRMVASMSTVRELDVILC